MHGFQLKSADLFQQSFSERWFLGVFLFFFSHLFGNPIYSQFLCSTALQIFKVGKSESIARVREGFVIFAG